MKALLTLLFLCCFSSAFAQVKQIPYKGEEVSQLNVTWKGLYFGGQVLLDPLKTDLLKLGYRPYASAVFGLGNRANLQVQFLVPTSSESVIIYRVALDIKVL